MKVKVSMQELRKLNDQIGYDQMSGDRSKLKDFYEIEAEPVEEEKFYGRCLLEDPELLEIQQKENKRLNQKLEEVKECEHKWTVQDKEGNYYCQRCEEPKVVYNKIKQLHDHTTINEYERGLESKLNQEFDNIYKLIREMKG